MPRPTFLLVHGGYHKPTYWGPLQEVLAAKGWASETISMPSAGEQPTAGLYDDAEALAAHLRRMEGPVVLVAHSHSGLTVTQLADEHPNVVHLVYIAAYMPVEGVSAADPFGIALPEDLSGLAMPLIDPRTNLYGDLPDEDAARAVSEMVNQSLLSCGQPTTNVFWRGKPSTYVICERDRQYPVALQEKYAAQATHVARLPTGHMPMLSAPAELAAILIYAARAKSDAAPAKSDAAAK